jgi:autotransporter adhesin
VNGLASTVSNLQQFAIDTRREERRGIAGAMAMSTAPLPSAPGKLTYVANGATFRGEFAAGGSLAYRLDTAAPLAITGGASISGGGNFGLRAGIMGEL